MTVDYKNKEIITESPSYFGKIEEIEAVNAEKVYLICEKAFYNSDIKSFKNLPNLRIIDKNAFTYSKICDFDFESVKKIDAEAFLHTKIINANMSKLKYLGKQAFAGSDITSFIAPLLESIKFCTFMGCYNLKHIEIPVCKDIDACAFAHCTSLRKIVLPKTLENVKSGIFFDCKKLEEITFRSDIIVPLDIFAFCPKLKEIHVSENFVELNKDFANFYKDKIIVNSLDDIIINAKSFKEINNIYKEKNKDISK